MRANRVIVYLNKYFPLKKNQIKTKLKYPKKNKYALLVALIISANTTDKQVNKVTSKLFKKASDPYSMINIGEKKISQIIKSAGMAKKKASYIYKMSKQLVDSEFKFSHKRMEDLLYEQMPILKKNLVLLSGVGNKIAGVYIINARLFDKNIKENDFPVDTHVKQFAIKFGLTKNKDPTKISRDLKKLFPPTMWAKLHYQMIAANRIKN